jgi:hypothetical protein
MSEQIPVPVSRSIFERLQKLAIPLIDNPSAVIERLLDHWEANPPRSTKSRAAGDSEPAQFWHSPRGDVLPVGIELQGTYLGKNFRATVDRNGIKFGGKVYENPSAAAVAAKNQAGTKGDAASTNGRDFWKLRDPETGRWVPISTVNSREKAVAEKLLAELEQMK